MIEITVEQIRTLASDESNISITNHVLRRFRERGINYKDVLNVLKTGEIIEQYPNDYPYPSCLEMGLSLKKELIHVCVGIGLGKLFIITAYFPTLNKWENDFKTRR